MNDLLDYNKILRGEFQPCITQFMVHDCINQILHLMIPLCQLKENKINVDYEKDLPITIFSDYNRI